MTNRPIVVFCLAIALFVDGAAFTSAESRDRRAEDSRTLVIASPGDVRSLDPHLTASATEANIFYNLYAGLTRLADDGSGSVPGIATSWHANASATVWTFRLRENATWSDGTRITAEDFVYSWRRIADPAVSSPNANLIYSIRNGEAIARGRDRDATRLGVRAVSPSVLEVTTHKPVAHFPAITSHYALFAIPRHAIERTGAQWVQPENHVSSGPFRLVEYAPGERVVLERREDSWDNASIKLDRLVFRPCDGPESAASMFVAGEADLALDLRTLGDVGRAAELKRRGELVVETQYSTGYYVFNVKKAPFSDPRVRRALQLAVDVEALCSQLEAHVGAPARSFVPSGPAGYLAPTTPSASPSEARRLLAASGYPGGRRFPRTRILINDSPTNRQVAEVVRAMWSRELGIAVEIEALPWEQYTDRREKRDFDVARAGWVVEFADPIAFLDLFQTDTNLNPAGWNDAKYTALLDAADRDLNRTSRLAKLKAAEARLLDAVPVVPLFRYRTVTLLRQHVRGYAPNMLGYRLFRGVSVEGRATAPVDAAGGRR